MYKIKLSPYAKIFYVEWQLEPTSGRYNLLIDQILYGNLDVDRLKNALERYVKEHVVLNSRIQNSHGELYWIPNDKIKELEYSDVPITTVELKKYISKSFDLHNEPLYRFKLIRIKDGIYRLIIVMHHLIMDGSAALDTGVFQAISNYYNNNNYTAKFNIDEQIKLITTLTDSLIFKLKQNRTKYQEFWRDQIAGVEAVDLGFLKLDSNYTNSINQPREIKFKFKDQILNKLNQIKNKFGISSYLYGQCIFALLLHRYTSQASLAISYPISIKEGLDFIYGAQVNTNLISFHFNKITTIVDLFNSNREFISLTKKENIQYGYLPITEIMEGGDNSKRLLNTYFIQTFFREKPFEFNGITKVETSSQLAIDGTTKDMLLFEQDAREKNILSYRVRYDKKTINAALLKDFISCYKRLFCEILKDLTQGNESKPIYSYSLLDEKQYRKIVHEWNKTDKDYPRDKTIHELFEEQTKKTPNNIAVIDGGGSFTYLNIKTLSDNLAYDLCLTHRYAKSLIAVLSEKGGAQVVATLGVMKSGNAYLPLNVEWPIGRIEQVLEEGNVDILLVSDEQYDRIKTTTLIKEYRVKNIDVGASILNHESMFPEMHISDIAYVIFTSGSTGKPKGVVISHKGALNTIYAVNEKFKINANDKVLALSELSFDLSVYDLFGLLIVGGTIVFPDQNKVKEPLHWVELIKKNKITVWNTVPQLMQLCINYANVQQENLDSLKAVLLSGDFIPINLPNQIKSNNSKTVMVSLGGATEGSIWSIWYEINQVDPNWKSIPYGRAMPNQKMYILDDDLQPLPTGVTGEICIGGIGVALEYWHDPEKTNQSFVEHQKLGRIYRTGDLGKWNPKGFIEILGRKDNQVKLHGFRIELDEIAATICKLNKITSSVVVIRQYENKKYLIAYFTTKKKATISADKISEYLKQRLPEYMIPSTFIELASFPLTTNGKIDKNSLPDPDLSNNMIYVAPCNEKEYMICSAFAKILGVKKVGTNDDFFKIGGNSIKSIQLTVALQNYFVVKVADIFNLRTPAQLAKNLSFTKKAIKQKLEELKLLHQNNTKKKIKPNYKLQKKIDYYLKNLNNLQVDPFLTNPIANVLLIGATGFLGCNILNQLLNLTNYNIYLLIRAASQQEAINRINKKYQFYFDKNLKNMVDSRVFVIKADIEHNNLGLCETEYKDLNARIDSVIHAAALVKHYGDYDKFYAANVTATTNLLEFTKLTKTKDFHFISTSSVLDFGFVPNYDVYYYTEENFPDNLERWENVYVKTKYLAELETIKYRDQGVNTNIYRVGNLAFIAENQRAQDNIEDSAFYYRLKCLFKLGCVAKDHSLVEISQVDYVAKAIVKLFDKKQLANGVYHVFNPHLFDLTTVKTDENTWLNCLTIEQFIDKINYYLATNKSHDLIVRFLLHQGWLDGRKNITKIKILQNRTEHLLKQLGFEWKSITNEVFNKYIRLLKLHGVNYNDCEEKI